MSMQLDDPHHTAGIAVGHFSTLYSRLLEAEAIRDGGCQGKRLLGGAVIRGINY